MYKSVSDLDLLKMLADERGKFTRSDKVVMSELISELQSRGVYPQDTVPGNPNSVVTMVECWGAYWHEWSGQLSCPHCHVDLRDQNTGPPFKREIAVYSRERDRTTHYSCPSCHKDFPR